MWSSQPPTPLQHLTSSRLLQNPLSPELVGRFSSPHSQRPRADRGMSRPHTLFCCTRTQPFLWDRVSAGGFPVGPAGDLGEASGKREPSGHARTEGWPSLPSQGCGESFALGVPGPAQTGVVCPLVGEQIFPISRPQTAVSGLCLSDTTCLVVGGAVGFLSPSKKKSL